MTTNTNAATWTDKQYLEQLAAHYQHSPVPEIRSHHERLMKIAAALTTAAAAVPTIPDAITHTIQRALVKFSDSELERLRTLLEPKNAAVAMFGTARIAAQQNIDDADAALNWLAAAPKAEPVPAGEYPPLPTGSAWCGDDDVRDFGAGPGESALMFEPTQTQHVPLFTAGQMRAYVDADRAMRAQAAPAVGGYPVSIVNLFSKMPKMVIFPDGTFPEGCPPPPMTPENLWKVLHAASEFGGTVVWGDAHLAAPAAVAGPSEAPEGWRNKFAEAVYADLEAADNQDVPLEEYPARILKALDSIVGPRHPTVIHWRNDAIQACIAIAYKYCRDPESFQYLKQDLQALIFAAPKVAPVAQGDAKDPLAGAAQWLLQAIDGCNISDLQSHLKIGFNRAERLMQDALAARSQAKEGA